ncbi:MAG: hypothetical protein JWP19_1084 [Rhodoglobus sp.]|nr:hypothetical protein [Rhodoglobus sp.]
MHQRTWLPTGFSASLTGGGIAGTWIESDAQICQKLAGYVEDKRFMFDAVRSEYGDHVFLSVQNVREYAVQAQYLPRSRTSQAAIKEIRRACRAYVSSVGRDPDAETLDVALLAIRRRIGSSLLALVEKYDLECDLDLSDYREDGIEILNGWMRKEPYDLRPN